jgi:hypothetical protein
MGRGGYLYSVTPYAPALILRNERRGTSKLFVNLSVNSPGHAENMSYSKARKKLDSKKEA